MLSVIMPLTAMQSDQVSFVIVTSSLYGIGDQHYQECNEASLY